MPEVENKELRSIFGGKIAGKLRVLGSEENPGKGLLSLGNYMALDHSRGAAVYLDVLKPHAILICGKRGYGKSYTMGVLIEELARLPYRVRKNFCAIVVDTMGIFTRMDKPSGERGPGEWGLRPEACPIRTFAPPAFVRSGAERPL